MNFEKVLETIKHKGNQTTNCDEVIVTQHQDMIPDNTLQHEREWQTKVRTDTMNPPNTEDKPSFSSTEIEYLILKLSNSKLPGRDLIETVMLKQVWPILHQWIKEMYNKCLHQATFPKQ